MERIKIRSTGAMAAVRVFDLNTDDIHRNVEVLSIQFDRGNASAIVKLKFNGDDVTRTFVVDSLSSSMDIICDAVQ